jgi:TolB protein
MRIPFATALLVLASTTTSAQEPKWATQSVDLYPSISPDGKRMVFQSTRLGTNRLFLADIDGKNMTVLPGEDARITPAWSPDGTRIAFAGFVGRQLDIFVMNVDGSGVMRITDHPGADMHPHWTADSRRIFFNSDRSTPAGMRAGTVHDIFSVSAQGSDLRRHTDCRVVCTFPAPSPDGRRIVYRKVLARAAFDWDLSRTNEDSEVVVADVDGRNEVNLSNDAAFDGWPAWSPDGAWVAFASNRAGPANVGQIYLVRPDGTGLRRLTSGAWSNAQPSFAPDGKTVFVFRLQEGDAYQYGFIAAVPLPNA